MPITYGDLGYAYLLLNRLDEAIATAREAQAHNVDGPFIHLRLYLVDFLRHDTAGMEREAAWLMGKLGYEDLLLYDESNIAAYGGELAKARELTRQAVDSARRADEKETAAGYEAESAVREALFRQYRFSKASSAGRTGAGERQGCGEYRRPLLSDWQGIPRKPRGWQTMSPNASRRTRLYSSNTCP